MGNFLQFLANNLQLLFFIAVAIIPAIGALVRWAEKQREERRRMAEVERRRLEALRTGRVEILQTTMQAPRGAMPAPATARQEEAIRRQREMQDRLRQRLEQQQRRQQQVTARPRTGPTAQRPAPARQRPAPPARRPAAPRPVGRQPGGERGRQRQAPPEIAPQTLIETPTPVSKQEIGASRAEAPAARARVIPRVGPGMTVQQLREAIVLRELLDRPLALRDRGPGPDLFD